MLIDKYSNIFNQSKDKEHFVKLVKHIDKKRKIKTIERDYYRLRTKLKKIVIIPKEDVITDEQTGHINQLRRLKLLDMKRYNIKITERLLQTEGFTQDEINIILRKDGGLK